MVPSFQKAEHSVHYIQPDFNLWPVALSRASQTQMRNKFSLWEAAAHGDATPPTPDKYQPPNIHMNLLFTVEGSLPLVCELQIQHERVMLELAPIQHKYYEVRRAADIDALC